ncbi:hypothetical protein L9F63_020432 [Diploptera punctata]|uniref:Chemosensory protein n=1 Tax=Diploptera punctata TaxID=6984 RepID=A0AAD7ZS72_DIPPU|nr:hypothetical protein L9F63_020432 [Diploptera punctata]
MKFAVVLCLLVAVLLGSSQGADLYTDKYDNIDLDEILGNDRLVNNCFNCLMDQGSCTPDCADLKKVIPEALETGCAKCSDKHKQGTRKVIKFLMDNKPDLWTQLQGKYDPDGSYKQKYEEEAKNL